MNMRGAYRLQPDQTHWGKLNGIEAAHSLKLPGVDCPSCGAWAMTGIIYPSVDMAALNGISLPASPLPIPVGQFKSLAAAIQPVLGVQRPVEPGTDLGPLHGRAQGSIGDFAWVNPWTPLLRESVWLALGAAGIQLVGARAEIVFRKKNHEALIEIEAVPRVKLPDAILPKKCPICGRMGMKKPDQISVTASSFDSSIPLQRIVELPTILVANEAFAQFIQREKLRDVILTPIEMR